MFRQNACKVNHLPADNQNCPLFLLNDSSLRMQEMQIMHPYEEIMHLIAGE